MASGKKRTSCAKAPVNRSASSAIVVKGVYPMMLKEIEKEMAVFGAELLSKVERREYFFRIHFSDVYISHRISVSASQPYQLYVSFMIPGYKLLQFTYADILFSSHKILTAFFPATTP